MADDQTPDHNHGTAPYLDVVGIGAINLDYIIGAPDGHTQSLLDRLTARTATATPLFEPGVEHAVDAHIIGHALKEAADLPVTASLGGSAFNTILALAQLGLDLRLGFVGVAGRHPDDAACIPRALHGLGIDHAFVREDPAPCGICLSVAADGQRTLLTHPGANTTMASYLDAELGDIGYYLARARAIHVSSFLDDQTPARLAAVLQTVRTRNPTTIISVDPGHLWTTNPTPDIRYILGLADLLLLNDREFAALGRRDDRETDTTVAARLLDEINPCMTVAVKRPDGVYTARLDNGMLVTDASRQTPIPAADVRDDTGAGDVCAAGILAVLISKHMQIRLGSRLGMQFARHTLRYRGCDGHHDFARITDAFSRHTAWPPPAAAEQAPNSFDSARITGVTDPAACR